MLTLLRSRGRSLAVRLFPASKMSSWSIEKNLLLNMSVEEKRKKYAVKSYLTLADALPWSRQPKRGAPLASDREKFQKSGFVPNASLDEAVAERVSVWNGDITQFEIDAIVNAANTRMAGGGGVDGAIHRAAGPYLPAESEEIGGCPTGEARMTGGYLLPARYIVHTVGPTNESPEMLDACYKSCFALVEANDLKSVAFPCVATGIYGFPNVEAAHIACRNARRFLERDIEEKGGAFERVIFCTFEKKDYDIYMSVARLYFPTR